MRKLLLISALLLFSVDAFAQQPIVILPFGVLLEHSDTLSTKDTYVFFPDGKVSHNYYYDANRNGIFNTKATREGVWARDRIIGRSARDYSIKLYLGDEECRYSITKIADIFVFSLNRPNHPCSQMLLKIKKEN